MSQEPERVDLDSPDLAAETLAAFEDLFPGVVMDGVLDAARLGELLDTEVTAPADGRERFGLMWAGKQDAVRSLLAPSRATLIPDDDDDQDSAGHVFIEGDNLEALKLLQKAYNDQVKLIYIDPPYNTGGDFIYQDNFSDTLKAYLAYSGQVDDDGNRLAARVETSGRRHSSWLQMMYPRLVLARNLLSQDGVIFVSIDDNESANLRLLMNEVFGEENLLACIVWNHTKQSKNDERYFSRQHNLILCYRRSDALSSFQIERTEEHNKAYSNPDDDPKGPWRSGDVRSPSLRPNLRYDIETPSGGSLAPPKNGWRWSKETVESKIALEEIIFSPDEARLVRKIYLADQGGRTPENIWATSDVGGTREAAKEVKEIFGGQVFDTPKPTRLIRRMLELGTSPHAGDIVLDFFAGSGSTADAVLRQNAEDGGNRRFIAVQLPEPTDLEEYPTIADITRARISAAVEAVSEQLSFVTQVRSYRLDASNFVGALTADSDSQIELHSSTLVDATASLDHIAAEIFLREGVLLDAPWERLDAGDASIVSVEGISVVLSLDLNDEIVNEALALATRVVVLLEDGFRGADSVKANAVTNAKQLGITLKTV